MTELPSWIIWSAMLRPWPYRFLIVSVFVVVVTLARPRSVADGAATAFPANRLGVALLGGQALALLATALFVAWTLGWTLSPRPELLEGWIDAPWRFYTEALCYELGLLVSVYVLIKSGAATWAFIGLRRPEVPFLLLIAAITACYCGLHFVIKPLSISVDQWIVEASLHHPKVVGLGSDSSQFGLSILFEALHDAGAWSALLFVLIAGVLTPVIEELFFRGIVFKALLDSVPTWAALIGQALLFAAMHLEMGRLIYLFIFGLTLGFLVRWTSSLLPAVLLHVVVNVVALAAVIS
ncbi:CPBP family intramembrane glutamic endopeptidase [Dyella silvae]|uniref:CPBP family intramembrane glutamic endopeptidase n=1 Tax=Dyella silvae TaxID=2994424 RepID=UPI002265682A|nr:CPBP family intramembrane glutamic endopeptidase [Dyella silvae]